MFVDQVQITVHAGNGGKGCDSYYQRTDRKTVPNGGDGGKGGSVIFRADSNAPGLEFFRFKHKVEAPAGGHGGGDKKRGRNGEDFVVLVPPGTQIADSQRGHLIRHLRQPGDEVIVAEGGEGGHGNQGGRPAASGGRGQEVEVELTLRLPADVFFVGLPNAGKSTLMNQLTRTHLKAEAYPFSTRQPELGVWNHSDYQTLTLCELPSIYESSHEGRGLGADFIKHAQGALHLFYVVDPASEFAESIQEGYKILRKQIGLYSEDLLEIPHTVLVNKMDLMKKTKTKLKKMAPGVAILYLSATTGEGVGQLRTALEKILEHKPYA